MFEKEATEIASEEKQAKESDKQIRARHIRQGKRLNKVKRDLAKARKAGKTDQTFEGWVEEKSASDAFFPGRQWCNKYQLVAQYPGAYEEGASLKEAYREARKWKANGGNPPIKEKVSIRKDQLSSLIRAATKLNTVLKKLNEDDRTWQQICDDEEWNDLALVNGAEELVLLKQEINVTVRGLQECEGREVQHAGS